MSSDWFSARLKELRSKAGLTQKELADRAGLTEAGIRNLEQGRTGPVWASVTALADALGVSCESFREPPSAEKPEPKRGRPKKAEPAGQAEEPQGNVKPAEVDETPAAKKPAAKAEPASPPEVPTARRPKKGKGGKREG